MSDITEKDPSLSGDEDAVRARQLVPGGLVLDRYIVEEPLSSGASGLVYRGRSRLTKKPVALKVEHMHTDATSRLRFEQEARLLAKIHHPNVVEVLDAGRLDDGGALLVMQLVPGITLTKLLSNRGGALPWREAITIVVGVLDGLDAAHEAGVIHRDVKPSNVMVDFESDVPVAKLIDFGIAKNVVGSSFVELTHPGEVLGTLNYMAPEQLTGEPAAPTADLYAIGVMLYQCLSGRLPYEGKGMRAAMAKVCGAAPQPLQPPPGAELWPRRVTEIVLEALNPSTQLRPPNAHVFAERLRECVRDGFASPSTAPPAFSKRRGVEFVALALPVGTLSRSAELDWISDTLRGVARPFIVAQDVIGALLFRGGTGESANIVDGVIRSFHARYGEIVVARERLEYDDANSTAERAVSDAAGRLAQRLSRTSAPPGTLDVSFGAAAGAPEREPQ
jgi:serine/threonine protein kinase